MIGDGTYLMGHTGELVSAVQEGLKITVIVIDNHGYQSIHALQRSRTGLSFGLEFRAGDGEPLPIDFAANAASLGCAAFRARSLGELQEALDSARASERPAVVVCDVEPHRQLLDSQCWWDVGVPQVAARPATRERAAEQERGRLLQRFLG